jgi:Cyanobacterial TRADD-N associated 2-Transmembrane domain
MRAPSDVVSSSSVAEQLTEPVDRLSDLLKRLEVVLDTDDLSETHGPSAHSAQATNAETIKAVDRRINEAEASNRRAQKRAMIWGGIALVLSAVGLALVVNRLSPDPYAGKYGESGVMLLTPDTLIWLTLYAATFLSAIAVVLWLKRGDAASLSASPPSWAVWLVAAVVVAAFGNFLKVSGAQGADPSGAFRLGHGSLGSGLIVTALGLFVISRYYSRKVRRSEQEMIDLQFEQDLLRHSVKPFQTRAEKLLSVNQIQLRRYYELNLEQAKAVFFVGIACIGAGLAVVGVTFWFVFWLGQRDQQQNAIYTQAIVAILGAIGSMLTNFVAFTYLRIHRSISENLMAFHKQLAAIHDLYFANVLAASVESKEKRAEVLMQLTGAIAERRVGESATPVKVA